MKKYKSIDDIPLKKGIKERCKDMRKTSIIVEVLNHWLKKRGIKTTNYDFIAYKKMAWNILDSLEHEKLI